MGREERAKERAMTRESRRNAGSKHARVIQYLEDAAIVTVTVTWIQAGKGALTAETATATAYGVLSDGTEIGHLAPELANAAALRHLEEAMKNIAKQGEQIALAAEKGAAAAEEEPPPDEPEDPVEVAAQVAASVEGHHE